MRRLTPLILFIILKISWLPATTAFTRSKRILPVSLPWTTETSLFVSASYEDLIQQQPRRLNLPSRFRQPVRPLQQVKRQRRTWEESYALLLDYYREHKNANVPSHYKADPKLGAWVTRQRRSKSRLSAHQIAQLDALGFTWEGANTLKANQQWEEMFQCLAKFQQQQGHCCVPKTWKADPKLARWTQSQRQAYTLRSKQLTPYRIQKLESIGFVWRVRPMELPREDTCVREELWEQRLQELKKYKGKHGHCRVPLGYKENPTLGNWVKTQRQLHGEGHLQSHRHERLDAMGFTWGFDEIREQAWRSNYSQLVELMKQDHQLPLGQSTWSTQGELWGWEVNQQNAYQRGTLDPRRKEMLQEIGYWKSLGLD